MGCVMPKATLRFIATAILSLGLAVGMACAAPLAALALVGGTPKNDAVPAQALSAPDLVAALPRFWHGTFLWQNGAAYFVEMELVKVNVRADGQLSFNAETVWHPEGTQARMSGSIDPRTLEVRIWEIPADDSADDFVSDGQYLGRFSGDLWDLQARWTTSGSGETGSLVLVADPRPYQQMN